MSRRKSNAASRRKTPVAPARPSDPPPAEPEELDRLRLERAWARPPGPLGWLASTNHKDIGIRYVVTAFVFFLLGGVLALMMRVQLARPRGAFLDPDLYNQFFTTHGTTMMFLFAVPVMEGMGLYLVPLMVGSRNVAFPKLMAFGYYVYLISGLMLYTALILDAGPDMGWFAYVPLSGPEYGTGKRVNIWSQMVTMVEISSLVGAVEIIATAFKLRAPGMSLDRVPLFVWAQVVTSFMVLFAMPSVMLCSTMLSADRLSKVNTHFFNQAEGSDPLLWQHLFWFFAHPDVYIMFLPATGFVSAILPTFARRKMFGYTALVLASVAVAFIGFGVWVHHMFAAPLPEMGQGLFTASSLMIVIPNGVQIFCWVATLWGGRPFIKVPMGFVLAFLATFVIGGLTGVMLASVSINLQAHDTFFVVAHLHYVLIGGAIFPLFGAFYYWAPKWTGRMLSERAGWWNLGLMFVGFHLTFFPMHLLGLRGMARRVYTYPTGMGWDGLNLAATIGAFLLGLGVLVFLVNLAWSRKRGRIAGPDPWGAGTLEWATPSPTPRYNFLRTPTARGTYALWEDPADSPVVTGLSVDARELLVTTTHDARPDHRYHIVGDSLWPLALAVTACGMMIGFIFNVAAIPIGSVVLFLVLCGWFWPTHGVKPIVHEPPPEESSMTGAPPTLDVSGLPGTAFGAGAPAWWGNTLFMVIETTTMALLMVGYLYTWRAGDVWPPPTADLGPAARSPLPGLGVSTLNLALLLASCWPALRVDRAARRGDRVAVRNGLLVLVVLGLAAIALRCYEFPSLRVRWDDNTYGSIVWAILGMHLTYVIAATLEALVTLIWVVRHEFDEERAFDVTLTTIYWSWMVGLWVPFHAVVYWAPRVL